MSVATIDAFHRDTRRFWEFYRPRFHALSDKRPNPAHEALAELERRGLLDAVITQNIDRLHRKAGSERGDRGPRLDRDRRAARAATRSFELEQVESLFDEDGIATCTCCAGKVKPDVVLFGELLPAGRDGARPRSGVRGADLLLCVGSSLEVYPVAGLPELTLRERRPHRDRHQELDLVRLRGRRAAGRRRGGGARRRCSRRSVCVAGLTPAQRLAAAQDALAGPRASRAARPGARSATAVASKCVLGGRDGGVAAGVEGRQIVLLVGAGASRAARPAAPRARRAAEAPPRGSSRVEVGAGSQQQRLADVDRLAAGEHRGEPLLRAQGLGAPLAPRPAAGPRPPSPSDPRRARRRFRSRF